jgi:hypothetical protein
LFSINPFYCFSFALGTSSTLPDGVEVVGGGIDQLGVVGEDTGLEVAVVVAFHTYAGTCEVGGADVGGSTVKNHYLEMHSWAEPLFSLDVLSFFCMTFSFQTFCVSFLCERRS